MARREIGVATLLLRSRAANFAGGRFRKLSKTRLARLEFPREWCQGRRRYVARSSRKSYAHTVFESFRKYSREEGPMTTADSGKPTPANARRTTLAAVARLAGVSVATVSKVVNGRSDVAPRTRSRVRELLEQHDYVAPVVRRGEVAGPSTIEVQFAGDLKPYVAEALNGIVVAAAELGASVVISQPDRGPGWARDLVALGRRALIAFTSVYSPQYMEALTRAGLPLVVLDPLHLPHSDVTSVGSTNFAGGFAATEHLLLLGHRRIAYLGGPAMSAANQARVHGYLAAMETKNAPVPN